MMTLGTYRLLRGDSGPCPKASLRSLFLLGIAAKQLSVLPQLAVSAWTPFSGATGLISYHHNPSCFPQLGRCFS